MSNPTPPGQPPDESNGSSRGRAPERPGVLLSKTVAIALILMGGCIILVSMDYDPVALVEVIARPLLR